jgi:hypothetical protein
MIDQLFRASAADVLQWVHLPIQPALQPHHLDPIKPATGNHCTEQTSGIIANQQQQNLTTLSNTPTLL